MRKVKLILVVIMLILIFIGFMQNYEVLSHPIELKLNLYWIKFVTYPLTIWMVILISFLIGFVMAGLMGWVERARMKREFRRERTEGRGESISSAPPAGLPSE